MSQNKFKTPLGENPYRLIRIKDVMAWSGLSKSYVYALAADGRFPQSISLVPGGTSRAWVYSEVSDWLEQRIAERDRENLR